MIIVDKFVKTGLGGSSNWFGICASKINNDIYASSAGHCYRSVGGTGALTDLGYIDQYAFSMAGAPNGDIFAYGTSLGWVWRLPYGSNTFQDYYHVGGSGSGYGMCITNTNDIYVANNVGYVYKQTNSTGSFVAQGSATGGWMGLWCTSKNNIYVSKATTYKQTGGVGEFVDTGIASGLNGYVYACVLPNDDFIIPSYGDYIYQQLDGHTDCFKTLGSPYNLARGSCVSKDNYIYVATQGNDIWKAKFRYASELSI